MRALGDWDARIAHASHNAVPTELRYVAPTYGENTINAQGRLLLQTCHDNNLVVMSGSSPGSGGPTCVGHGSGEHGAGTSVVDHIIGTQTLAPTMPLPRCITLTHAEHGKELRGIDSDHCPVLQHVPRRAAAPTQRRAKVVRPCVELLEDAATLDAYQAAIQQSPEGHELQEASKSAQLGNQDAADAASVAAARLFSGAVAASMGTRVEVQGITKRHVTPEVARASEARRRAHSEHVALPTPATAAHLAEMAARSTSACNAAIRHHKKVAEEECIKLWSHSPGTHKAYKALSGLSDAQPRASIGAVHHPTTGARTHSPQETAEALGAHYAAMAQRREPTSTEEATQRADAAAAVAAERVAERPGPPALEDPFSSRELRTALRKMPNRKAPGGDGLPAELLKQSGRSGKYALLHLMNTVWKTGCIPSSWRQGEVVSVHKADDPMDCNNYRPLTMLPAFDSDKLFALLLVARLGDFVPLHNEQYAFRRARGTPNALFGLTAVLRDRARRHLTTYAAFFDAQKTYDTVDHTTLMAMLAAKGVTGRLWRLVDRLYAAASNRARVDGFLSEAFAVLRGVAQGCPLSPFLYIVFQDSLMEWLYAQCRDDGVPIGGIAPRRPQATRMILKR